MFTCLFCRSARLEKVEQHIDLRRRFRKGLHYYFYWDDEKFGLSQVRLMTFRLGFASSRSLVRDFSIP